MSNVIVEGVRSVATVVESEGPSGFTFEAVVSEADHLNRNRRVYPESVLFPAFEAYNQALFANSAEPGLVDHPDPFAPSSVSDIGIKWLGFRTEGKQVFGKGRIVPTQKGRDLQAAIEAGLPVGFSTRGYGATEEFDAEDGRPAKRMTAFDLRTVDAVVDPSVFHARVRGYTKEELDTMENELNEAREALSTAEARVGELESTNASLAERLSASEAAVIARGTELNDAQARIRDLETRIAELEGAEAEALYTTRLNELTAEHRFGATIRAQVAELRQDGVAITAENVEKFVTRFAGLVEAAAAAANTDAGQPRGDVSTSEDAETPNDEPASEQLSAAQIAELEAAGLI